MSRREEEIKRELLSMRCLSRRARARGPASGLYRATVKMAVTVFGE